VVVCTSKSWSICNACKKFDGAAPPKGRNVVSRNMSAWVGQYEPLQLFCLWTKVHKFFSSNCEGDVVDKILLGFAICWSFPEILAIKFENCQKSRRILDVFSPSQILGDQASKRYTHFITPASHYVAWKSFFEDTPTNHEVIGANTLNFKRNFKLLTLNFLGGWPHPSSGVR